VEIPGKPTLPNKFRSIQLDVVGQPNDVYVTSPWRAPGLAPVYGSGCGAAGGGPVAYANGGFAPPGIKQGMDGLELASMTPVTWKRGSTAEVAWAISANHGGGYSWRLCKNVEGLVNEDCFQKGHLKFSGDKSWVLYSDGTRKEFPMTKVTEGTYPEGSEWARDPVPGCKVCDAYTTCGSPLPPVPGKVYSDWDTQVNCYARCDGSNLATDQGRCENGTAQFPEASPGISGFGKFVWNWGIMDLVEVPTDIEAGDYLLGWRWDCEESTQVWENCADITIV
jgi:hypothetical protein